MYGMILISLIVKRSVFTQHKSPYHLIERLINTSTNPGDNVLDMFSGSGTTAVACKLNNRNFYGCEIDPRYYDMSMQRISFSTLPLV